MADKVISVENTEKAREFWHEVVNIFSDGGFNLLKFRSNDEVPLRKIADGQVQQFHKALVVSWDLKSVELLPLAGVDDILPKTLTKREVISLLSKIYDPSGLVSPVVTALKIIVQELWKEKVVWDEEVNHEFRSQVWEALKGFSGGNHLGINRWLGVTPSLQEYTGGSLHVFTDASSRAHAAAAYLRVTDAEKKARLLNSLRKEYKELLKIDAEFLWSDSSVALAWINQGPRVFGVFVANRVEEITAVGGVWSWVPTDENPADLPTRGTTVSQLSVRKIWWNSPYWFNGPETEWPKQSRNDINVTTRMMAITDSPKPEYLKDIVDPQRTSKFLPTLRSIGWI
ncbi:uncharacterized protein [Acropora muricata]|uniref:uncharacterized protein n=1 Tax=Acropora muricata TaxID=159855 RepID=UPI0034E5CA0F